MTFASRFMGQALKLPPSTSRGVDVQRDLRVPMPDGAVLLADRYAPRTRPWPVRPAPPLVLVRSPYGRRRSWGLLFGRLLAERGFQAVIQSCRGTFGSGGTFDPFGPDEHDDGLATVAWLREQPWYPGSFGTCGPSYLGMTQWAIAADAGADLGAIAAQVTTADFRAPFYPGGSFSLETAMSWLCQVAGQERPLATLRNQLGERGRRPLMNHLPLRDLDRLGTGRDVPYWQKWLAHDAPGDGFWAGRSFAAARCGPSRCGSSSPARTSGATCPPGRRRPGRTGGTCTPTGSSARPRRRTRTRTGTSTTRRTRRRTWAARWACPAGPGWTTGSLSPGATC